MGDEAHDRLSALRATMGWRGAQENFDLKYHSDQWKCHFSGLFTASNRGNTSNVVKK